MLVYYKGAPDVVVLPGSAAQVQAVVRRCLEAGVPIVPRGSGTGLIGGGPGPRGGGLIGVKPGGPILEIDGAQPFAGLAARGINPRPAPAGGGRGAVFSPRPPP